MMGAGTVERITIQMNLIRTGFNRGMKLARGNLKSLNAELGDVSGMVNKRFDRARKSVDGFNNQLGHFDKGLRKTMPDFQMINKVAGMSKTQFDRFSQTLDPSILQQYGVGLRGIGTANKQIISTSKKSHKLQDSYNSILSPAKKMQQDYTSTLQNASNGVKQSSGFYDTNNQRVVTSTELHKRMTSSIATGGAKAANSLRMFTHGLRGFRMEALGVMFFGMMLAKTFQSLLNPALEAYGVMELWKTMLLVVFMPIVDEIFPILLKLMEYFMNQPEPIKKMIGVLAVLGYIFSQLLFVVGAFILGIGSLIFFWGPLIAVATLFASVLLPIWAIFVGLTDVLSSTEGSMGSLIGKIKMFFGVLGLIAVILHLFPVWVIALFVLLGVLLAKTIAEFLVRAATVFKRGIDRIKAAIVWAWDYIMDFLSGGWDSLYKLFKWSLDLLVKIFGPAIRLIIGVIKWLWDNIIGKFKVGDKSLKEIVEAIKAKVIEKFKDLKDKVLLKIEEMKTKLTTKFEALKTKFKDWGVSIVDNLVAGITKVKNKVVDAILSLFPEWAQDSIKKFGSFVVTQVNKVVNRIVPKPNRPTNNTGGYPLSTNPFLPKMDDFIWRSGQGAVSVNPNDTLVGYKGSSPFGGGGGETNITNNFYGFTTEDLNRELDDRDSKLVNELQRLVKQ